MVFLPPATKLGQSYVFTHVCDSVHRGVVSQHALQVVSQHALQDSRPTPRGEVQGSDQPGGSPGPHPGGVSRPTPKGVSQHTQRQTPPMATAAGQYASYWNAFLLL